MLKRARIMGYKSLWDAEITFADPLTLIIGPNAAGKTNLLDALALLSRIVTLGSVKQAFAVGHRGSYLEAFSFGEDGLAGNMKNAMREMRFEIDVELSPDVINHANRESFQLTPTAEEAASISATEKFLRYELALQLGEDGLALAIKEELLHILDENGRVQRTKAMFPQYGHIISSYTPDFDIHRAASKSGSLNLVIDEPFVHRAVPYDITIAYALKAELARWQFYDLDPKEMSGAGTYIDTAVLPNNGKNLASFFYTMKSRKPRQFAQVQRELSMIVPQIDEFDVSVNDRAEIDLTVREHGARFSAKLLSEGTLRVLGMLAASSPFAPVSLIGLEEPENGIHPRRLELVATHFRNLARFYGYERQVLLTTHSPLLPAYLAPEQVVVCQRWGNRTRFIPLRDAGLFALDDMDAEPDENGLVPTTLSQRIVRGDYGG